MPKYPTFEYLLALTYTTAALAVDVRGAISLERVCESLAQQAATGIQKGLDASLPPDSRLNLGEAQISSSVKETHS